MNALPKVILTPLLVGSASLAERRWGPVASGLLVGLPLTSGPVAFFIAVEQGPGPAMAAASGALVGAIGQAAFAVAYARLAAHGGTIVPSLVGGLAFAVVGLAIPAVPAAWLFVCGVAAIVVATLALPAAPGSTAVTVRPPAWDIPARISVATALVVGITAIAPMIGGRWSGILATFPVYALILTTFAHRAHGSERAIAVLRGLLIGLLGFEVFFAVLTQLLPGGLGVAFAASIIAAIVAQVLLLVVFSRSPRNTGT